MSSFSGDQRGVLETPRPLQEPPLPLLPFFRGRRWISELINLLACEVEGLRCGFRASPLHRLRPPTRQASRIACGLDSPPGRFARHASIFFSSSGRHLTPTNVPMPVVFGLAG